MTAASTTRPPAIRLGFQRLLDSRRPTGWAGARRGDGVVGGRSETDGWVGGGVGRRVTVELMFTGTVAVGADTVMTCASNCARHWAQMVCVCSMAPPQARHSRIATAWASAMAMMTRPMRFGLPATIRHNLIEPKSATPPREPYVSIITRGTAVMKRQMKLLHRRRNPLESVRTNPERKDYASWPRLPRLQKRKKNL